MKLSKIHLFGKPLSFEESHTQLLSVWLGLSTLSSDALSSVAYATDQVFFVLWAAGAVFLHLALPIAIGIAGLLAMVTLSYRQTIFVYKNGGGSYFVAKDNFRNKIIALIAASALFVDYILTVAVSVTSGIEQVVSAHPAFAPFQVALSVGVIMFIMYINLRGIKEAGALFAVPTYFFISMVFLTLGIGFYDIITNHIPQVVSAQAVQLPFESFGLFLLLRAIANGCTAMTGVEAISNGIPNFKEDKSKNAAKTMALMSVLLVVMFVGLTFLAIKLSVVPSLHETVMSQLGRIVFQNRALYLLLIAGTTSVLLLAANTSYAAFPRLAALLAADGYLPKQFTKMGDRLAFSYGIVALTICAITLVIVFEGHTTLLIPLYAIGVFIGFTISQFGMVLHWKKRIMKSETAKQVASLRLKQLINFSGAVLTGIVLVIFSITKFAEGAWVTLIAIPVLVMIFQKIKKHHLVIHEGVRIRSSQVTEVSKLYRKIQKNFIQSTKALIFVDTLNGNVVEIIKEVVAEEIPFDVIHIQDDEGYKTAQLTTLWQKYFGFLHKKMMIVHAPHRKIFDPMKQYIREKIGENPRVHYRIYIGGVVDSHMFRQVLHQRTSASIMRALQEIPRITIATSFYHV